MHLVVKNQLANMRQETHSTKTRSEVRGGGRKPWRQREQVEQDMVAFVLNMGKGGIAFGPKPRSYRYTLPKKVKRLALKSALTSKLNDNNLIVVDSLTFENIKTKQMVNVLNNLKVDSTALIVLADKDENVIKSARNISGVKTTLVNTINVFDILKYDKFIVVKDAVSRIEEVYA